jgi:HEAT repeat protein
MTGNNTKVSDDELKNVIADFLSMGHVENIVAMFQREPRYYDWAGELLRDERMAVRLGFSVLFEELKEIDPEGLTLAIPSLKRLLHDPEPLYRGEALSLLGIIDNREATLLIFNSLNDENPQVREMANLLLEEQQ